MYVFIKRNSFQSYLHRGWIEEGKTGGQCCSVKQSLEDCEGDSNQNSPSTSQDQNLTNQFTGKTHSSSCCSCIFFKEWQQTEQMLELELIDIEYLLVLLKLLQCRKERMLDNRSVQRRLTLTQHWFTHKHNLIKCHCLLNSIVMFNSLSTSGPPVSTEGKIKSIKSPVCLITSE